MEKLRFKINNKLKECDVLYTFHSDNTNNHYLVCTDHTEDNGVLNVYSFLYDPKNKKDCLQKIEKEEDWNEVERFLELAGVDYND